MNYRLFQYSLPAPPELEDLNAYIQTHRVVVVTQNIVQTGSGGLLVFETAPGDAGPKPPSPRHGLISVPERREKGCGGANFTKTSG
jgi:hypothetical protein